MRKLNVVCAVSCDLAIVCIITYTVTLYIISNRWIADVDSIHTSCSHVELELLLCITS